MADCSHSYLIKKERSFVKLYYCIVRIKMKLVIPCYIANGAFDLSHFTGW